MRFALASLVALSFVPAGTADGPGPAKQKIDFSLRGKTLQLAVYVPPGPSKGTVIMGSGDVGWVGLSVSMSEFLSQRGYTVIGFNSRQYLSAFTDGRKHLETAHTPADFDELRGFLDAQHLLHSPVVLSGVSEGAALMVLAASHQRNHSWIHGVVTMGTPMVAELAWRWTDFTSWITKKDSNEPSFSPADFIAEIAPLPLVMIQSRKDEYVPEADYRRLEKTAQHPKKLVLIDASNHRFTDRQPELRAEMLTALDWIRETFDKDKAEKAGKDAR
jgi:type IV secretory pathway VirJ component